MKLDRLIKGIHHVSLKCCGIEEFRKTVHFYNIVLGMEILRSWGNGDESSVMIDTGSGVIEIFANANEHLSKGTIRHFALMTDDVDACIKAVRESGFEVVMEPNDIVIKSNPEYPARIAFCKGPIGEEIEFFQER
ncbi:MAG: VOC family protein [Lachnospiraceae bacterium]|nr:VOC family protein [Lachnospiraceae bacterium]